MPPYFAARRQTPGYAASSSASKRLNDVFR